MSERTVNSFVAAELKRMLAKQQELDPSTDAYAMLLRNIEVLAGTVELFDDVVAYVNTAYPDEIVGFNIAPWYRPSGDDDSPFPLSETDTKAPSKVVELHPVSGESGADMGEQEHKSYEMAEVRAALVEARKRGVNVTEVLREFGVENFGAFPAGRYWELMERLGS